MAHLGHSWSRWVSCQAAGMDSVDSPNIGHRADTVVDVEGEALPSRPDDMSDAAVSGASSPADPDPDDDWVEA